jgi:hypothetical protein
MIGSRVLALALLKDLVAKTALGLSEGPAACGGPTRAEWAAMEPPSPTWPLTFDF